MMTQKRTPRLDTTSPRLPSCAAWPTVSHPGWIVYTPASCSETGTDTQTGKKENQVNISRSRSEETPALSVGISPGAGAP